MDQAMEGLIEVDQEKKDEIILRGGQWDKDSAVRVIFLLSDMNNREQKNK